MFEYRIQDWKWVVGRFVPEVIGETQKVYVFAFSQSSFMETMETLKAEYPNLSFVWVKDGYDLDQMAKERCPAWHLADDWRENEMTADYRFRNLMMTRHLGNL